MNVFAFACRFCNQPGSWGETIYNRASAGQAKVDHFHNVRDAWPDVRYVDVRCRKVGPPVSSEQFLHNARYRGMPDVRCGDLVKVGDSNGVIVGHNSSANFDVLFIDGKWSGTTMNVHPREIMVRPKERERGVEDSCLQCGRPNVVWFAPNQIWNKACPSDDIICPVCFIEKAQAAGFNRDAWIVKPEFYEWPERPEWPEEPTYHILDEIVRCGKYCGLAVPESRFPADWNAGKEAQRRLGANVIPGQTEYEIAYGQYQRMRAAHLAEQGREEKA